MEDFESYLQIINNVENKICLRNIFSWIMNTFPSLEYKLLWKQPMFLDQGTFIIGFSVSKEHFSISPESKEIEKFAIG